MVTTVVPLSIGISALNQYHFIIGTSRLSVKIEYKMADQWTEALMVISSSLIV